jgi:hypothetical protein
MKKPHLQSEAKENSTVNAVATIVADSGACLFASIVGSWPLREDNAHMRRGSCHLSPDYNEFTRMIVGRHGT